MEGETGKEMNKGTRAGKFGGSEGRKKEGLEEEEDVQTVLPVPVLLKQNLANPKSLGPELVQISEIFGLVKLYCH